MEDDDDSTSNFSDINGTEAESSSADSSDRESGISPRRNLAASLRAKPAGLAQHVAKASLSDDESDTSSTLTSASRSSSSSSLAAMEDMAMALATRLRNFRHARMRLEDSDDVPLEVAPQLAASASPSTDEGMMVRVAAGPVTLDCRVQCLSSATQLLSAVSDIVGFKFHLAHIMLKIFEESTPDQQLDDLLVAHTDAVLENKHQSSSVLLDFSLAQLKAHLAIISDVKESDSALDLCIEEIRGSMRKTGTPDNASKTLDIIAAARRAALAASPQSLSHKSVTLKTAHVPIASAPNERVLLWTSIDGLGIKLYRDEGQDQLRAKIDSVDLEIVTPDIQLLADFGNTWRRALDELQSSTRQGSEAGLLLYRILQGAGRAGPQALTAHPSFAYETAYALHVDDPRNVRKDTGWIMLSRLRYWLTLESQTASGDQLPRMPEGTMFQAVVTVLSQLDDVVGGMEDLVRQQDFVQRAFPTISTAREHEASKDSGVFVNIGSLRIRHHARLLESGEIALSTLSVSSASVALHMSALPHTHGDQPSHNTCLVTTAKSVGLEVQSGASEAIESILGIMQRDMEPSSTSAGDQPPARDRRSTISIDVNLHSVTLSLLAGGLRLRFSSTAMQMSIAFEKAHQANSGEAYSTGSRVVTVCAESTSLALLQPVDEHDLLAQSSDRVVIAANLNGLRTLFSVRGSTGPGASTAAKILIGLYNIDFASRPQLRAFYTFIRDWQGRHLL